MNTAEIGAVIDDTAARMTWKLALRGAVAGAIQGAIVSLAVVVSGPGSFDLYSWVGLAALAKIAGTGAFVGMVLYLKGVFEASPPKTWDGIYRRKEDQ